MTGMYKAMEDCVGLGVDEIMDIPGHYFVQAMNNFLSLSFPDIDWYHFLLEVRIVNIDSPVSALRMASSCGISRDADEVR